MSDNSTIIQLLTNFEHQYSINTAEITAKIGQLSQLPTASLVSATNEIRKALSEVEDLLEQMELSVREINSSSPDRSKYDLRVKSFRKDKRQLDGELRKAIDRLKADSDRAELFSFDDAITTDQQHQLISNTERLERVSRKVDDAYRVTIETEEVGSNVLENLSQQRDTLTRARERMREAESDLSRSNKIVSHMIRRIVQNRLILLVVTFVMMFSLLVLIYKAL